MVIHKFGFPRVTYSNKLPLFQTNATAHPGNFEHAVPLAMDETRFESGSVGSAGSAKTYASSVGMLGPMEVDGEVFLKVRQCPLSG
eukprot:13479984-Heterocapsa_arctica.AAC.1